MPETEPTTDEKTAKKRDWTKGPIVSNLLRLAWPMVIMESLYMLGQIIDMIWVGRLGPDAIAGVGMANICVLVVMSMDIGLIIGVRAMVSRYSGAGDMRGASRVAGQAVILGAIWGLTVTVGGVLLVKSVFGLFGMEPAATAEGIAYLWIIFAGWGPMGAFLMGMYSIQASGDSVTPMIVEASTRIVHIAICPFLVLGWGIFPRLGVSGAAISNVISSFLGIFIILWILFKGRGQLKLTMKDLIPAPDIIWRMLKIGIPSLILHTQKSLGDLVLAWLIVPFGTLAVAAHSLVLRVEMLFLAVGIALGSGAGVLAGLNLGAGRPERAEKSGWTAMGGMEIFMAVFCAAILLRAEAIVGIFTVEGDLIRMGSEFLRIAAAGYIVIGTVFVLQDCISGAGDTVPAMIGSIAMVWVVQLPLSFLLPRVGGLGVYGVRWAIVIATFTGAVFYTAYFISGRWKTKTV